MSFLCPPVLVFTKLSFTPAAATVETQTSLQMVFRFSWFQRSSTATEGVRGGAMDNKATILNIWFSETKTIALVGPGSNSNFMSVVLTTSYIFFFCLFSFPQTQTMGYCSKTVQSLGMFIFKSHHTVAHSI